MDEYRVVTRRKRKIDFDEVPPRKNRDTIETSDNDDDVEIPLKRQKLINQVLKHKQVQNKKSKQDHEIVHISEDEEDNLKTTKKVCVF